MGGSFLSLAQALAAERTLFSFMHRALTAVRWECLGPTLVQFASTKGAKEGCESHVFSMRKMVLRGAFEEAIRWRGT
jgi:hypothetical protein